MQTMKDQGEPYDDELDLPPSYNEAISSASSISTNVPNVLQQSLSQQPTLPQRPPPQPPRPSSSQHQRPQSTSSNKLESDTSSLYTNNANLPFKYPIGVFCRKCKNTGFRKRDKICTDCWYKYYLNTNAYNPNSSLPFKYPKRFICEKCHNKGYKLKNGKSCKDCWERFAKRNTANIRYSSSGYLPFLSGPMMVTSATQNYNYSLPPIRMNPGDPRLGGVLCGNCRGSGRTYFLLDEDICSVCNGLGRVITGPQNFPPGPPGPPLSQGYYPPPPPQQTGTYNSFPNPPNRKN